MSLLPSFRKPYPAGAPGLQPRLAVLEEIENENKAPVFLLVEAVETRMFYPSHELKSASLVLHYEQLRHPSEGGSNLATDFSAGYLAQEGLVSLSSSAGQKGGVFVADGLEGRRIGTYLMNRIVAWAKQWPDAEVHPVTLKKGQAQPNNRERRNRFWEQFGLEFEYDDPNTKESGVSRSMRASQLKTTSKWEELICEHRLEDFLGRLVHETAQTERDLMIARKELRDSFRQTERQERHPFIWAIRYSLKRHWLLVISLVVVGLFAAQWCWFSGR